MPAAGPSPRTLTRRCARRQRRPDTYLGVNVRTKGLTRTSRDTRATNTPHQTNFAHNFQRSFFKHVRKRCDSNSAHSRFEAPSRELRAKFPETRDSETPRRDPTTTNRGNCTTQASDTPATRRQRASCSAKPPTLTPAVTPTPEPMPSVTHSFGHADPVDTLDAELVHSHAYAIRAFDSRTVDACSSGSHTEAAGSNKCRHR